MVGSNVDRTDQSISVFLDSGFWDSNRAERAVARRLRHDVRRPGHYAAVIQLPNLVAAEACTAASTWSVCSPSVGAGVAGRRSASEKASDRPAPSVQPATNGVEADHVRCPIRIAPWGRVVGEQLLIRVEPCRGGREVPLGLPATA
jgi:hypothetical protein